MSLDALSPSPMGSAPVLMKRFGERSLTHELTKAGRMVVLMNFANPRPEIRPRVNASDRIVIVARARLISETGPEPSFRLAGLQRSFRH
jgi:hypothetical protein